MVRKVETNAQLVCKKKKKKVLGINKQWGAGLAGMLKG